jgi:cobyric acid synthase CobQ/L-threonine-O-3-phosphate decarboxylase
MISTEYGHGGNIHAAATAASLPLTEILDFSANINPLGAPPWLRSCIARELDTVLHYPDPSASVLKGIIARKYKVPVSKVFVANGSTELLYQLPRVLQCKRAVIPVPCYIDYIKVMENAGIAVKTVTLREEDKFILHSEQLTEILQDGDIVLLGSPNNPTAQTVSNADIAHLAAAFPGVLFLVDEAFLEFVEGGVSLAGSSENIITLHSLTKFYAIPGLRLGFGVFPDALCADLQTILPPWTVNSLAQKVGEKALNDLDYQQRSRIFCNKMRGELLAQLSRFPELTIFPGKANYLLVKLAGNFSVETLQASLVKEHILIRNCSNYHGLNAQFFRIAVRSAMENQKLFAAFSTFFNRPPKLASPKKTPAIMFQGTSSNAGKSVLTAALCRILLQDGIRVAPFKAQNMSLNSYVTADGLEMGRAQVVQAQAARLDPHVLMNPILLKPNSDTGSQIIVKGKPLGNMSVMEYVRYKESVMGIVSQSYDELAHEYQAIVLEGAGSPGEVNLKSHDIVNMRMARHAKAPVLLVGDIDRGGVYASFVGHLEVMEQWERQLVAGFVVNRFRGNSSLLSDAHDYVKEYTGKDVLGVIPYLHQHGIPEEDSVSFKDGLFQGTEPQQAHIDIAVINLPHISNFTDLEPFIGEPDVYLRVVSSVSELGNPDVLILPGSKNVIFDLLHLRNCGLLDAITHMAKGDCEVLGICGGYQMLGRSIADPHGIESKQKSVEALSLLDMETSIERDKTLTRKSGVHLMSDQVVSGYEIHHGRTINGGGSRIFNYSDGSSCGTASAISNVWGSYLHGVFDSDLFRRWFINDIRQRKGLHALSGPGSSYDLEPAFDRLAHTVRDALDMEAVYQMMGL